MNPPLVGTPISRAPPSPSAHRQPLPRTLRPTAEGLDTSTSTVASSPATHCTGPGDAAASAPLRAAANGSYRNSPPFAGARAPSGAPNGTGCSPGASGLAASRRSRGGGPGPPRTLLILRSVGGRVCACVCVHACAHTCRRGSRPTRGGIPAQNARGRAPPLPEHAGNPAALRARQCWQSPEANLRRAHLCASRIWAAAAWRLTSRLCCREADSSAG